MPPDRDHDLDSLADQLPRDWRVRASTAGRLTVLARYAVDTRYPDAVKEPTRKDAQDAMKTARAVYLMVIRDLAERGVPVPSAYYPVPRAQPPAPDPRTDREGR